MKIREIIQRQTNINTNIGVNEAVYSPASWIKWILSRTAMPQAEVDKILQMISSTKVLSKEQVVGAIEKIKYMTSLSEYESSQLIRKLCSLSNMNKNEVDDLLKQYSPKKYDAEHWFKSGYKQNLGQINKILTVAGLAGLVTPVYKALSNISKAEALNEKGDPKWNDENFAAYRQRTLAWLAAEIGGMVIGYGLFKSFGSILKLYPFGGVAFKKSINTLTTAGTAAIIHYLNTEDGANIFGKWLAGELYLELSGIEVRVPGGETFENIIGKLANTGTETGTPDANGKKSQSGKKDADIGTGGDDEESRYEMTMKSTDNPIYAKGLSRNPVTGELEITKPPSLQAKTGTPPVPASAPK